MDDVQRRELEELIADGLRFRKLMRLPLGFTSAPHWMYIVRIPAESEDALTLREVVDQIPGSGGG